MLESKKRGFLTYSRQVSARYSKVDGSWALVPEIESDSAVRALVILDKEGVIVDHALLHALADRLAGEKARPTILPIEVPDGFTWLQVALEFVSDVDVRIWTVGEPSVKSFAELGFANVRDGSPTKPWHLLREFAGHEGVYDPSHASALYAPEKMARRAGRPQETAFSGKIAAALSGLAKHLMILFPTIPGRPIAAYDNRLHQYCAVIKLRWEPGYRQRKAQEYVNTR